MESILSEKFSESIILESVPWAQAILTAKKAIAKKKHKNLDMTSSKL
jgi:hypothetical protein